MTIEGDGTLGWWFAQQPWAGEPQLRWHPAGPDLYSLQSSGGQVSGLGQTIAFVRDGQGQVIGMANDQSGPTAWDRIPWYEALRLHIIAFAAVAVVLLAALVGWPVAAAIRRRARRTPWSRGAAVLSWTSALLALGFTVLFLPAYWDGFAFMGSVIDRPPWLYALFLLPVLVAIGSAASLLATGVAWRLGWWTRVGRVGHTLVSAALLLFVLLADYYNLVGWNFA